MFLPPCFAKKGSSPSRLKDSANCRIQLHWTSQYEPYPFKYRNPLPRFLKQTKYIPLSITIFYKVTRLFCVVLLTAAIDKWIAWSPTVLEFLTSRPKLENISKLKSSSLKVNKLFAEAISLPSPRTLTPLLRKWYRPPSTKLPLQQGLVRDYLLVLLWDFSRLF